MTIFLYGPDSYRLRQGIDQVIDGYKKKYKSGLNLFSFDLSDKDQRSRFEDVLKTTSFFEEAKLVLARNTFSSKDVSESTRKILTEQGITEAKSIFVAVAEQASQKNLEKTSKLLFKDLISSATVRNFEYLEGTKLINWIRSEFVYRNCSIDSSTAKELVRLLGNESLRLVNEIEKLSNYKQKGPILLKDIELLVAKPVDLNIFDLVDAVVTKNRSRAYELLYRELKNGRDAHYLLTMMAYGFRSRAERLPIEELKLAYGKLTNMDTLSKNGSANLVDSIFEFIITS